MDEPSSALDPIGRQEVRRILQNLKEKGVTIFLNSHLLEDVEVLCDRMALLNNGVILRHGKVSEVLNKRMSWRFKVGGFAPILLSWLKDQTGLQIRVSSHTEESIDSSRVWLEAELESEEQVGWLNTLIIEQGMTLYEVSHQQERLEEWFMNAVSGLSHRGEHE